MTIKEQAFTFTDGSGIETPLTYGDCMYLIQPSIPVPSITLSFDSFLIGSSNYIRVYSGTSVVAQVPKSLFPLLVIYLLIVFD